MLTNKKGFFAVIFTVFAVLFASAQNAPSDSMARLATKYLNEAEESHENAKFEDAYKKVNAAITMYANYGEVPQHIYIVAKPIYKDYLTQIKNKKMWDKVEPVLTMIDTHSELQTTTIKTLVKEIQAAIENDKEAAKDAKQAAQRAKEKAEDREMMQKISEENQKSQENLAQIITDNIGGLGEDLAKTAEGMKEIGSGIEKFAEETKNSSHTIFIVIICLAGIIAVVFVIVIINHIASAKSQRMQQDQFEATLKLVAGMQQQSNQILLGAAPDLYSNGMRSAGSSRWGIDALPAPELDDKDKEDLKKLAIECEELGTKIDQSTGRKNNSKNVSELVYKLACHLGLNHNTAMAYFCAAMVYDAGFLSFDQEILQSENLTAEQRAEMKNHVDEKMFKPYFINVPEMYKGIFRDAASSHHENMDGSGYPRGLNGEEIPQIARLIHVVESYTSLISRRNYKEIRDRDSAINDLMSKPELYDKDVVAALDAIL